MMSLTAVLFAFSLPMLVRSQCEEQGDTARCEYPELSGDYPLELQTNPKMLYLIQVEGEVPAGTFVHMTQVQDLEMYPGITYIEPGAFEGLKSIESMNLFNNSIRYLVRGTFRGCGTLRHLILKDNRINYIEPYAFLELVNLYTLDLSGNSEIGVLRDYMFSGMRSLTMLQCYLCGIGNIEPLAFYNTTQVKELNLQSNFIGDINGTEFEQLTELEKLDLAANQISYINVERLLYNLVRLRQIVLVHNRILCADMPDLETRFVRRNVVAHVRTTDNRNNQRLSCLEPY